jgi:hypothetical protein
MLNNSRRSGGHYPSAFFTGAGTHVNNPIAGSCHPHLVFYKDHCITGTDQAVQLGNQPVYV